jgi:3'-phosphoadenosine 5'-phosphosulfate sulfotransferase (PAPS reductase)/FAD synthetase
MRPDDELKGSFEVYPILNWNDNDVLLYLEKRSLPTMSLYRDFGVSGCSWCPFYGPDLYAGVLRKMPNWYDRFIAMEEELNIPSVQGGVFLRDIKAAVLAGTPIPVSDKGCHNYPCMVEYLGKSVLPCEVYGHSYIDGVCLRCGNKEIDKPIIPI